MQRLKQRMTFLINRGVAILLFLAVSLLPIKAMAIHLGMQTLPSGLDSRLEASASAARILRLVSEGLVYLDDDFTPKSRIAEIDLNEPEKKLLFHLKNHQFHDGSQLTAPQLELFYNAILQDKIPSPLKGSFADILSIKAENDKTLAVYYTELTTGLWEALQLPILKLDEALGRGQMPIGLGDYKVVAFEPNRYLRLKAYKKGIVDQLEFSLIKDPMVRLLKLQKGEIDIIQNDMPVELYNYGIQQGLKGLTAPSLSYTYLGFNLEDKLTGKKELRHALAYALNVQSIIDTLLQGYAEPAESLLSEKHPFHHPVPQFAYSPKKAEDLLDELGYPRQKDGYRFSLDFSTTNNPFILRVVQIMQQQLKEVGIKMNIHNSEWGTFYGQIKKGNFQMYLLTWVGRFQQDIYKVLFHSDMIVPQGANRGRYQSNKADQLIDNLVTYPTPQIAQQLQELIHKEDMVYVPLWKRHHLVLMNPNLKGYSVNEEGDYSGLKEITRTQGQ